MSTREAPSASKSCKPPEDKSMGRSAPRPRPRILSVSPASEDHVALRRILDRPQWRLDTAGSCGEALAYLREGGAVVIFCEHSLPDGSWKKVLDQAAANNAARP